MDNYWSSKTVQIGNIRRNKKVVISFQALPNIPEIKDLISQCGCTKINYNTQTRILQVTYSSGEIPKHIHGNQIIDKKVTIVYQNNEVDELHIKGIKLR